MNRSIASGFALLWTLVLGSGTVVAQTLEPSAHIVTIDRINDRIVWLLNSKPLQEEVVPALSRLHREGVPDKPMILLVQSSATLGDIYNALELMSKAKTAKPRIYSVAADRRSMNELVIGSSMPLSPDSQ
jgi:hypothetical protein